MCHGDKITVNDGVLVQPTTQLTLYILFTLYSLMQGRIFWTTYVIVPK